MTNDFAHRNETTADASLHRYDAFISYRRVEPDARVAMALLRAIETFRPPRGAGLPARRRLKVFLDRAELSAAPSVDIAIQNELRAARFLIVVCSPQAEESAWVRAEVAYFHQRHGSDRILPVLVAGDTTTVMRLIPASTMPLYVDVRAGTPRQTLRRLQQEHLRLLARLLDCRYDELERRDYQRRVRRLQWVALLLVVALASFVGLAGLAYWQAKLAEEAQARENEALQREGRETAAKLVAQEAELKRRQELDEMTELLTHGLTLLQSKRDGTPPPWEIMAAYRRWEFLEPVMEAYTAGLFRPQTLRGRIALMRHITDWGARDLMYGRLEAAQQSARRATEDCDALVKDYAGHGTLDGQIRYGCVLAYEGLGRVECEYGHSREAAQALQRADAVGADSLSLLGKVALRLQVAKVALAVFDVHQASQGLDLAREALIPADSVTREEQSSRAYYIALTTEFDGNVMDVEGKPGHSAGAYRAALSLFGESKELRSDPTLLSSLSRIRRLLARSLSVIGQRDEALAMAKIAVSDATDLVDLDSPNLLWRRELARAEVVLARIAGDDDALEQARVRYERVGRTDPDRQPWPSLVYRAFPEDQNRQDAGAPSARNAPSAQGECSL